MLLEDFLLLVWWLIRWGAVAACCLFGVVKCTNWYDARPETIAANAVEAAQEQRERTPHVIREADGCKVYAFKADDHTHFFTRCGETVTTERQYEVSHGKTHSTESETIVTKGNQ